jgi:release factor glutamine methyltransferase
MDKYDIVISNPPYISELEYKNISRDIKFYEPKIALIADKKGFEFYIKISEILPEILTEKSKAFIEIGSKQANKAIDIFKSNGINCLKIVKDIQKLDRLLILNKS